MKYSHKVEIKTTAVPFTAYTHQRYGVGLPPPSPERGRFPPTITIDRSRLLLRRFYPPTRALHSALPTTQRPTPLLCRRARRKHRAARRVDVHERLRPRDVPAEQANGRRSEERRSEGGALAHLGPHDLEPAHVGEHLHREVPVGHAPVHLEVRELGLGVQLHALDHCVRLERVRLERRARDVRWRRV